MCCNVSSCNSSSVCVDSECHVSESSNCNSNRSNGVSKSIGSGFTMSMWNGKGKRDGKCDGGKEAGSLNGGCGIDARSSVSSSSSCAGVYVRVCGVG